MGVVSILFFSRLPFLSSFSLEDGLMHTKILSSRAVKGKTTNERMNIAEFATRVDLVEVAHNDHLDLHCLPSSHRILNMI